MELAIISRRATAATTSWSPTSSSGPRTTASASAPAGLGAGSIAAYALRITDLCPLEHGLFFERFLNPERPSMPDFDIDFDDRRRGEVIPYVTEKYGADRVAQIATFGRLKAKQAIKDAARVLDHPFAIGDRITKALPPDVMGKGIPLRTSSTRSTSATARAGEFRALLRGRPRRQDGLRHRARASRARCASGACTRPA